MKPATQTELPRATISNHSQDPPKLHEVLANSTSLGQASHSLGIGSQRVQPVLQPTAEEEEEPSYQYDGDGSSRVLMLSLNEGELPVPQARIQAACDVIFFSLLEDEEQTAMARAVVVARQEALEDNDQRWEAALAAYGFQHKVGEVIHHRLTKLQVYAKDAREFKQTHAFSIPNRESKGSSLAKGVASVILEHRGSVLGFACCHLDGNMVDEIRLEPMPKAMTEAAIMTGGRLDAVLIMGDVNSTISPTPHALAMTGRTGRSASSLQVQLSSAKSVSEEKALIGIPEELKADITEHLGTPAGRKDIFSMDGCSKFIGWSEKGPLADLQLVDMPPSSWPTYRLCTPDDRALEEFRKAGATTEQEGVLLMSTELELSQEATKTCFFGGSKGHAGAIKKRGGMTRLGMGWLDRLYVSTRRDDPVDVSVTQGTPILLISQEREALDHALMPWLVDFNAPHSARGPM